MPFQAGALVRVVALGKTPAGHPPPEVPMRRISLAVVLALSHTLAPFAAEAQPAGGKVYRIAILANESSSAIDGLRHGLRDLGYLEGRDIKFDYAWAGTRSERFPALAADVVRQKPDFIVT